jgi:colanic acid biosynthesis glycosyl transferase WcaI
MRVMIFGALYEPDLGPSAPLFTMLCENLVRLGHQVTMITMVPHYPSGYVSKEYRGKWIYRSVENGVEVIRIGLPSLDRSNLSKRMLQFACYQIGATWAGFWKKYDVVLAASSALTAWMPFFSMVYLRRKPAIYSVYDVYPGVGVTLNVFRHKAVIGAVAGLEKFCLRHATIVRIISDSFRPELRAMGVPDGKMVTVYDWVDTDLVRPLPKENEFSLGNEIAGHFVVLYAGNIGLSQGLEHVLSAAEILRTQTDIRFVFVGDGASRERLMADAEGRHLANVKFIPFQSREQLPLVLASADVSLVSLQRGIGLGSLPSKTYSILASGRPVIASVDEGSETWNLIQKAGAGLCIPPEDPQALAEAIVTLKNDRQLCEHLGQKGRTWAEKNHSPQSGAMKIESLLLTAISSFKGKTVPSEL